MTRPRLARAGLLLLLLLLVVAGIYLYNNLDTILKDQVRQALRDFGVEEYRLDRPGLTGNSLSADELWLRGHYERHDFEASLKSLRIEYDWRTLLTGQVQSVSLSELELRLSGTAPTHAEPATEPATLEFAALLPRELMDSLPTQSLDIGSLQVNYRAPGFPDLAATGSLSCRKHLELSLAGELAGAAIALQLDSIINTSSIDASVELVQAETSTAQLTVRLGPLDSGEWEWGLAGRWDSGPLLDWLRQFEAATGTPSGGLIPEGFSLSGVGIFAAQIRHPESFSLQEGALWPQLQSVDASAHLEGRFAGLNVPGVISNRPGSVQHLYSVYSGLTLAEGQLEVRLLPLSASAQVAQERLPIEAETQRWLKWGQEIPIRLEIQKPLFIGYDGDQWTGQLKDASLALGDDQSRVAIEDLHIQASYEPADRAGSNIMLSTLITTRLRGQALPPLVFALRQQGPPQASTVHAELEAPGGSMEAGLEGLFDLQRNRGELQFNARSANLHSLAEDFVPPLRKLGALDADLVIEAGTFELASTIVGADTWSQSSQIEMMGVSGQYDDYRFNELSIAGGWKGLEEWQTAAPVLLTLKSLDAGFDVSEITARFSLPRLTPATSPAVEIESFSANLFGGRVFLPEAATWNFGAASNSLTLRAEQWQLGQIVALHKSEDIQAQGVLEGELPVTMASGRLMIDQGYLRALPPGGTIRYASNDASRALGQNSKELELALSLLSDFRHEVLSSAVELDESGNLLLGLSLAGHNPDQYDGQPVNFNINLEQNLDPLLQSLRLSGKLTEEIENRLQ